MTPELALQLGRAVTFVAGRGKSHVPRIVIGKDTRLSGYMLEQAIASGVCAMGGRVMLCGPMPTPAIAHLTVSMRADAGIVISASHNPYQDNGIKVFGADGFKLPDEAESEIEQLHRRRARCSASARPAPASGARSGSRTRAVATSSSSSRPSRATSRSTASAWSSTRRTAPPTRSRRWSSSELGAQVTAIGVKPNGVNINKDAGALHPEHVRAEVVKRGAAIGIALDGDADRVIVVDEKGQIVDGDQVLAMCATRMASDDTLRKKTVVATVMSNLGLEHALDAGRRQARTHAGRRPVRRRGDARGRLQPRRRAVGAPRLPRPRVHGRRHPRRAAGARAHAAHGAAAERARRARDAAGAAGARERHAPGAPAARGHAAARRAHGEDRARRSAPTAACSCAGAAPSRSSGSCSRGRAKTGSARGRRSSPRPHGGTRPRPRRRAPASAS